MKGNSRKIERLDCRATKAQKARVERAASLLEQSVSEFLLEAACARAESVIREAEVIALSRRDALALYAALDDAKPTEAAREAAKAYTRAIESGRVRST